MDEHLQEQNSWLWIIEMFRDKEHELQIAVSYDETMLEAAIDGLACMQEGQLYGAAGRNYRGYGKPVIPLCLRWKEISWTAVRFWSGETGGQLRRDGTESV